MAAILKFFLCGQVSIQSLQSQRRHASICVAKANESKAAGNEKDVGARSAYVLKLLSQEDLAPLESEEDEAKRIVSTVVAVDDAQKSNESLEEHFDKSDTKLLLHMRLATVPAYSNTLQLVQKCLQQAKKEVSD